MEEVQEVWEGTLAIASSLDAMVNGSRIPTDRLRKELGLCGADPDRVIRAMLESGLFLSVYGETEELALSSAGRLVFIHLSCIL